MQCDDVGEFEDDESFDTLEVRNPDEVAKRCVVLYGLASVALDVVDGRELVTWLRAEGLWPSVSPREAAFLTAPTPTPQQLRDAGWRIEAIQPLLWALPSFRT